MTITYDPTKRKNGPITVDDMLERHFAKEMSKWPASPRKVFRAAATGWACGVQDTASHP